MLAIPTGPRRRIVVASDRRMVDPSVVVQLAAMIAAAAVGAIAGARRGGQVVERRAEIELERVVTAQAARIALLERHREDLEAKVAMLEAEVGLLRNELELEKKITARIPRSPRSRPAKDAS